MTYDSSDRIIYTMENTYWNNRGTYQADYDRLVELMPAMGKCDTVAGELMRSASRLGYDFYNNGMGNNTSGAYNFLESKGAIDDTVSVVYEYSRGRIYDGNYNGDRIHRSIESLVDQTVKFILDNPELETTPNTEDMFDYEDGYEDDNQHFCVECGDELTRSNESGWGHICNYCYEEQCLIRWSQRHDI